MGAHLNTIITAHEICQECYNLYKNNLSDIDKCTKIGELYILVYINAATPMEWLEIYEYLPLIAYYAEQISGSDFGRASVIQAIKNLEQKCHEHYNQ